MANELIYFTTPVGRLVGGSVDKPQDKDADGKPLIIKSGPNIGKPTVKYYVAIAIPKTPGVAHWASEPQWGAHIWDVGHKAFPGVAASPQFSWKVEDGDSQVPNLKGHKPCDREGYKGCWVMHCGSNWPMKAYDYKNTGKVEIDPKQIKRGYFVQIAISCQGNGSAQKPGVYLNPQGVDLTAFGPEITTGFDADSAGFGQNVSLPPGATLTPVGGMTAGVTPPPPATSVAPPVPGAGAPFVPPPLPGAYAAPAAPAAPLPPANPAILGVAPPDWPAPPAAPAVDPRGVPTAKAAGATLDAMLAWPGWTLDTLKANGYVN
jgi:hypothetical protein